MYWAGWCMNWMQLLCSRVTHGTGGGDTIHSPFSWHGSSRPGSAGYTTNSAWPISLKPSLSMYLSSYLLNAETWMWEGGRQVIIYDEGSNQKKQYRKLKKTLIWSIALDIGCNWWWIVDKYLSISLEESNSTKGNVDMNNTHVTHVPMFHPAGGPHEGTFGPFCWGNGEDFAGMLSHWVFITTAISSRETWTKVPRSHNNIYCHHETIVVSITGNVMCYC